MLWLIIMNYNKNFIAIILILDLLFLTGCVHLPESLPFNTVAWKKRQIELQRITSWKMSGVLSVTCGAKRDTVRFKWVQKQDSYHITISSPLGVGGALIIGDKGMVEFCRTRKNCITAKTPEQLTLSHLGWQFPISNIRYWILAMPVPHAKTEAAVIDQYGHLISFSQSNWQIRYTEFQPEVANRVELPKIIELTNKDIKIKIKVDQLLFS